MSVPKIKDNYRMFFALGVVFFGAGVATGNYGLLGVGAAFYVLGIVNREKWNKDRTSGSPMED